MNNQFSLQINAPCTENFDTFSSTQQGGFCDSCKKEVIDFTRMNTQEIVHYFQANTTQNTCGRFKTHQLKTYDHPIQKRSKLSFISGIGLAFIALFSFGKIQGQEIKNQTNTSDQNTAKLQDTTSQKNITVKGTVTDDGGPLPGANVILEGTTLGVSTDFDGHFEFPEKLKKGDVLVVSYIGFNSKRIVVQNENSAQSISMKVNLKMDSCVLMGKVAVNKVYNSKRN
ncbi:carboxypeptidase-like regulatory domain-containing protein [Aquimarina mytili]|uniref:Carboxypeptidase-like regulatory domain-containing protein n=1 Tax=Aquimarina mytili TaxID=874423 RepID=A0A936ZM49_9FLAO|nr:carboxypeptidase-like regulatory domain-containing protein [Aquimarina mytili]MBL0682184.1 carboxypeptidase-like regulatory domain-containing protein [Aquimarina mytili]